MKTEPLRTLVTAYGLAAMVAAAAAAAGVGLWASLLGAWIGGAAATIAIAAASLALRRPDAALPGDRLPAEMADWEDDRARDRAGPEAEARLQA